MVSHEWLWFTVFESWSNMVRYAIGSTELNTRLGTVTQRLVSETVRIWPRDCRRGLNSSHMFFNTIDTKYSVINWIIFLWWLNWLVILGSVCFQLAHFTCLYYYLYYVCGVEHVANTVSILTLNSFYLFEFVYI